MNSERVQKIKELEPIFFVLYFLCWSQWFDLFSKRRSLSKVISNSFFKKKKKNNQEKRKPLITFYGDSLALLTHRLITPFQMKSFGLGGVNQKCTRAETGKVNLSSLPSFFSPNKQEIPAKLPWLKKVAWHPASSFAWNICSQRTKAGRREMHLKVFNIFIYSFITFFFK